MDSVSFIRNSCPLFSIVYYNTIINIFLKLLFGWHAFNLLLICTQLKILSNYVFGSSVYVQWCIQSCLNNLGTPKKVLPTLFPYIICIKTKRDTLEILRNNFFKKRKHPPLNASNIHCFWTLNSHHYGILGIRNGMSKKYLMSSF